MMDPGTSTSAPAAAAAPAPAAASASAADSPASPAVSRWAFAVSQRYQHLLDRSVPHAQRRWVATLAVACVYLVRVYFVEGFYIVTYALGIYMLNLLIGFLSPQVDPELQELAGGGGGGSLPTRGSDEFRPFVRRLPEFKCWLQITWAFVIAFVVTFFSVFDVPVFWPVLLFYWVMLFTLTMRRQIMLMVKYKYVPFTFGKRRYGKRASSTDSASLPRD